jgi:O-antigen ligase
MRLPHIATMREWKLSTVALIVIGLLLTVVAGYFAGIGSEWVALIVVLVPGMLLAMRVAQRRALFPYVFVLILGLDQLTPDIAGSVFTLAKVGVALLLGAYLLNMRHSPGLRSYRVFVPAALLLFYFTATTLWSPNSSGAAVRSVTFALLLTSFWLIAHFAQTVEDVRQFLGALVLFALLTALLAVFEFADQYSMGGLGPYIRAASVTGSANDSAFIIALGALILIGLRMRGLPGWRWLPARWHVPALILCVAALLMTGSRGGLLAFAAGFLVLVALTGLSWRNALRLGVTVGVSTAALIAINQTLPILDNLNQRLVQPLEAGADITAGRLDIWQSALDEMSENALGGYGLSSSTSVGLERPTHNSYLWAFLEGGVIGLLIWCGLLASAGWVLWRVRRHARQTKDSLLEGFAVIMLALLMCGAAMALSGNVEYHKHLWLILALAEALYGLTRQLPPHAVQR